MGRIKKFFQALYIQLFKINDTPQRISLGFGLGVFLGIFPGTGVIAAIFCALLLRVNRASTLLGCLLTNTWISIVTFLLSIKVGSSIMQVNWQELKQQWKVFLQDFRWVDLFRLSAIKIILPVIVGYVVVGVGLGILAYLVTLVIIKKAKYADKD
jgi:uncharacterized protein (DUF2062 family)